MSDHPEVLTPEAERCAGGRRRVRVPRALLLLLLTVLVVPRSLGEEPAGGRRSGTIVEENRKPGAADWQLTRVRPDGEGYRSPSIEGYCSRQSVAAGESVDIMV